MIVIVAPYSPANRAGVAHLGAARKIETVVSILSRQTERIVLLNTAHAGSRSSSFTSACREIGGVDVLEVALPTSRNRRLGKALNLLQVSQAVDYICQIGRVSLVWLYNGYAFESRFGRKMRETVDCPIVLEMEDWHYSRGRGLNPKPVLDWLCWRSVMPHVTYTFAVNDSLANRIGGVGANVGLFPGVVADGVEALKRTSPPFSSVDGTVTVGYFGGLSSEKGADHVANLIPELPENYRMVVTGAGELAEAFEQLAARYRDRLTFHGRVEDTRLLELIGTCDVLLNPHAPIDAMANGVFPFKVIEGVASGRLMISTPLPAFGLEDVLQGVHFVDHDFRRLLDAVVNSPLIYASTRDKVRLGSERAASSFSSDAILAIVKGVCDGVGS